MCEENTIFHRKIEIQCLNTISAANLCINQLARPCLLYVSLYESDFPKSPEFSRYDFVIVMVVAVASACSSLSSGGHGTQMCLVLCRKCQAK